MKSEREFTGTLLGFDDFVSKSRSGDFSTRLVYLIFLDMVLEDVTE